MKVLLVDDHPLILAALQSVIRGLGDDVTVVGVSSEREARAALKRDPDYDLLLLDLHLGDSDGFDLLADFRKLYPALPIVVVSASDRASDVIRAIDAGAMGFVPKRATNDTLFDALRLVMNGGIYVPPMTLGLPSSLLAPQPEGDTVPDIMRPNLADVDLDEIARRADAAPHQRSAPSVEALGLSPRQTDVLGYLL
jgi:DNA-binding NarL/FixJ family response regulator